MTAEHDRAFFEQMATCRAAYRSLADAINHVLWPRPGRDRVLDVGAGLGFVAGRLAELGWDATASDPYAPEDLRDSACGWWRTSRRTSRLDERWDVDPLDPTFDVVICTETAEHINASAADTIVTNVARLAQRLIVWSAAQPGQEWPGHVNLQPPPYWLSRFARLGLEPLLEESAALRSEMRARHAQHEYAADNFFILRRRP